MVGTHYYKSAPSSLPKCALSKITRQWTVLDYLHWIGNWDPVFSSIFPPTAFLILTGERKVLWWRFQGGGRVICILTTVLEVKWSEVKEAQSCPTLCDHGLYSPRNSPGQNTGMSSLSLLQGIFPTRVSCTTGGCLTSWATREAHSAWSSGSHILVGKKVWIRVDHLNLVTKSKTQRERACQNMRLKRMEKS